MSSFFRNASPNERIYIQTQDLFSSMNIQCFFVGKSTLSLERLQMAVDYAAKVCPGSRLVYHKGKWLDSGKEPTVSNLEHDLFDGYNFDVLNLQKNLLLLDGPPIEVLLVSGKTQGILFRMFHGIMDGKGALIWIENVFRALRKEALIAIPSRHSDLSFIQELDHKKFNSLQFPAKKILPDAPKPSYQQVQTHRITIKGNYGSLVPKMMKCFAKEFCDSVSLFMVPVSLRKKDESVICSANLVLPIFMEVDKEDSIGNINQRFMQKIKDDEFLNIANARLGLLGHLPDGLLKWTLYSYSQMCRMLSVFSTSGVISYVGNYELSTFSCDDFACSSFFSIPLLTPFSPVSVVAYKNTNAIEISISYNASLFTREQMRSISEKIRDEITERRAYQVLNTTHQDHGTQSLWERIQVCMRQFSHRTCIKDGDVSMTYAQLDEQSAQWASYLSSVCEQSVVVLLPRSISFVVCVVASIRAGITFVPIDPSVDRHMIQKVLLISDSPVIVNDASKNLVEGLQRTVIHVDSIDAADSSLVRREGNPAYRIYTSGSTGTPKGVDVMDGSIVNYLQWAKRYYKMDEHSGFSLCTSLSVDLTMTSYLLPLLCGGCVYVFAESFSGVLAKKILSDSGVTHLKLTPSHLKIINSLVITPSFKKCLILGGEELSPNELRHRERLFGSDCMIVNEYGPTETTIGCTAYTIPEDIPNVIPVGTPIDNASILIISQEGQMVKVGNMGEIYVGGACVSRGYTGNPDQTSDRFVEREGVRYYRTGDLGFLSREGLLMYCGRQDGQVKIHGRRIELSEIEAVLLAFGGMRNVFVRYDKEYVRIVALYDCDVEIDQDSIREYMSRMLPTYKHPRVWVHLTHIPLAVSGKVDEAELIRLSRDVDQNRVIEPIVQDSLSKMEQEIVAIFARVLKRAIPQEDMDSTFIEMGGDSLCYIELLEYLGQVFVPQQHHEAFTNACMERIDDFSMDEAKSFIQRFSEGEVRFL